MPFNHRDISAGLLPSGPGSAALVTGWLRVASGVVLLLATSLPGHAVAQSPGTVPSCTASQWTVIMATTSLGDGGGVGWDTLLDLDAGPSSPTPGSEAEADKHSQQGRNFVTIIGAALKTQYATECETLGDSLIAQVDGCPEPDSGCNVLIDAVGGLIDMDGSLRACIGIELGEAAIDALSNLAVICSNANGVGGTAQEEKGFDDSTDHGDHGPRVGSSQIRRDAGDESGDESGDDGSADPTASPTASSTSDPSAALTAFPTSEPTADPTAAPTADPTAAPSAFPTSGPTASPIANPSANSTASPTASPTVGDDDSGGDSGGDNGDGDDSGGESGDGSGDDPAPTLGPEAANDFVVTVTFREVDLPTTLRPAQRLIIAAVNAEMAVAFGAALTNIDTTLASGSIVATTYITDATIAAGVDDIALIEVPALGITGSVDTVVVAPRVPSPAPTAAPVASADDATSSSSEDGFKISTALGLCIVVIGAVFVAAIIHHFYHGSKSESRDLRSPNDSVTSGGGGGAGLANPVSWSRSDGDLEALRRPGARPQSAWDDIPEVAEATMLASGSNATSRHTSAPNGTVLMADHAASAELDGNLKHKLKSGVISKYEARQIALVHNRALEMAMEDGDIGGPAVPAFEGRNSHQSDGTPKVQAAEAESEATAARTSMLSPHAIVGGDNGPDEDPTAHRKMRMSMLRNKLVREEITQDEHDAMTAVIKREAELED